MTLHPLDLQSCNACGAVAHYVRSVCPACGAEDLVTLRSSGRGTVHATTHVQARSGAYNVSLVELDEGVRIMTEVLGEPAEVRIGARVDVEQVEDLRTAAVISRQG